MEHATNMMFASACTLDGASSVEMDPCVPVSSGLILAVEFSTTSGPYVSFEYGETAQCDCDHGHSVDGKAGKKVSFEVMGNSDGNFTLRPQVECKPVMCSLSLVVPRVLNYSRPWDCHAASDSKCH